MDQRETESGCGVLEEVVVLTTGPEPAAFTCEPISFRLVQRPVVDAPALEPEPTPAPRIVEVEPEPEPEPAPRPYYAADDDDDEPDAQDDLEAAPAGEDDDGVVARRAPRVDPRLTDPDTLERAKRVEVYRVMIEQDPQASIFNRTNSPPRRVLPAPRTL